MYLISHPINLAPSGPYAEPWVLEFEILQLLALVDRQLDTIRCLCSQLHTVKSKNRIQIKLLYRNINNQYKLMEKYYQWILKMILSSKKGAGGILRIVKDYSPVTSRKVGILLEEYRSQFFVVFWQEKVRVKLSKTVRI